MENVYLTKHGLVRDGIKFVIEVSGLQISDLNNGFCSNIRIRDLKDCLQDFHIEGFIYFSNNFCTQPDNANT